MLDALLVSNQNIAEDFFRAKPFQGGGVDFPMHDLGSGARKKNSQPISAVLTHSEVHSALNEPSQAISLSDLGLAFDRPARRNEAGVHSSGERAIFAVRLLKLQRRRLSQREQIDGEMRWLADNRCRFSGQWIALQGTTLLATGHSAKEVFAKVSNQPIPPLVIRVEDEERPFAGW